MTAQIEPSGGYAKGRKRRETIINSAYDHFSSYGYQGSSLRDISSSIGVTHAGLRYHFEAKEDLLIAVLQKYAQESDQLFSEELVDREAETGSPWAAVASFIESIQFSLDNPGFIRLFSAQALLSSEPGNLTYEFFAQRMETVRGVYTRFIEVLQDHTIVQPQIDTGRAATLLLASLDGLYMQHLVEPDQPNVIAHIHLLLRAMCLTEAHEQLAEIFGTSSAFVAV